MTQFVSLRKIKRKIKEMRKITFKMRIYYFADLTQAANSRVARLKTQNGKKCWKQFVELFFVIAQSLNVNYNLILINRPLRLIKNGTKMPFDNEVGKAFTSLEVISLV